MLEINSKESENNIPLLEVNGEVDAYTSLQVEEAIGKILDEGKFKILLDLSDLNYIDSTGLGVLVKVLKRARTNKGDIRLFNLNRRVENVFKLTNLTRVFKIYKNREKALKFK